MPELLQEAAAAAPGGRAVVMAGGGEQITYAELGERVERLAAWLERRGVRRGDRIAVRAANGVVHFDAYLAAARLGAACVPLAPSVSPAEVGYVVGDAAPALGVADAAGAGALQAAGLEVLVAGGADYAEMLATPAPSGGPGPLPDPADTVLVVYTSGTTGRPKGVCLSQAAVACNAEVTARHQEFGAHETYLGATPLHHATAALRVFVMVAGAHTHVVLGRFEPEGWLAAVESEQVTSTIAVPTQIRRILDHDGYSPARAASLRLLVYGAAPSARSLILRMRRELPCGLYHGYGLTESGTVVAGFTAADHRALRGPTDPRLGSVGLPVPGVEIVLRRPDGSTAAPGEVGEIAVRSPKVMSGYWGDPAATAATFVGGALLTGDLGVCDEAGYLTLVGRSKEVIISGGVNLYPAQIERVIAGHPAVAEVAVFGVADADWGEAPVAAVRLRAGAEVAGSDLADLVAEQLDRRSRPRRVIFVDDFPRTPTGKIRRTELPGLLAAGAQARRAPSRTRQVPVM